MAGLQTLTRKYAAELGTAVVQYLDQLDGVRTCEQAEQLTIAALRTRSTLEGLHGNGEDWLSAGRNLAEQEVRLALEAYYITPTTAELLRKQIKTLHTPDGLLNYCRKLWQSNVANGVKKALKSHPALRLASDLQAAA